MKRNSLWLVNCLGLVLLVCTSQASASTKSIMQGLQFKPYFGWEYLYEHIKGNGTWGEFMPANLNSQEFFVGNRYHKNFGIEIGYYHTLKKTQSSAYVSSFMGVPTNGNPIIIGQMRNEGFSFDWDIYIPLDPKFNIMGIIGLVTYHPDIQIFVNDSSALSTALSQVTGRNTTLLRLGVGLEYEEKHWGARTRVMWDQTQKLYVNVYGANSAASGVTKDAFKQACIFTAGIFYIF